MIKKYLHCHPIIIVRPARSGTKPGKGQNLGQCHHHRRRSGRIHHGFAEKYGIRRDVRRGRQFRICGSPGEYTMVVQSVTAHRKEFPVTIETGRENVFPNIEVKEDINQLEEVVVTGQFSPQSMKNSLYKVRSVNSDQIRQKGTPGCTVASQHRNRHPPLERHGARRNGLRA